MQGIDLVLCGEDAGKTPASWARGRGIRCGVENGTATTPSLILGWHGQTAKAWPVSLFITPRCMLQIRVHQVQDVDGDVVALTQALCHVPGSGVDEKAYRATGYRKRANLDLTSLADHQTHTSLLTALAASLPP